MRGWRIEDAVTYYRVKGPCGDHQRSIHLTPSNPNYSRQALNWLRRQPCETRDVPGDGRTIAATGGTPAAMLPTGLETTSMAPARKAYPADAMSMACE